jgi:hypothetical protein
MAKQFDYQQILDTFRRLQEQANQANQSRYDQILQTIGQTSGQVGGTYDKIGSLIQDLGNAQRGRIEQGRLRAMATNEQDLINRGLANTTIRSTTQRGISEDASRLEAELQEQINRQQADVLQQRAASQERLGSFLASMMERRSDVGPDANLVADLLRQAGESEAGAKPRNIQTGLSANARAGRDVFGNEFRFSRSSGTPSAPSFGRPSPAIAGGFRGGGGAQTITAATPNERVIRGGSTILQASQDAAGRLGQMMFSGQPPVPGTSTGAIPTGVNIFGVPPRMGNELVTPEGKLDLTRLPSNFRAEQPANVPQTQQAAGGGTTITVEAASNQADSPPGTRREIRVPAEALGNGPGGFKDTATYQRYVPWGYRLVR